MEQLGEITVYAVALVVALFVYFAPSITAFSRGHKSKVQITMVNLLTGWTVIGWVVALVWSLTKVEE